MKINHTFYKKAHEKHNTSAKALHWNSKESQEKRFEVLINFIKDDLKNSSLIDAGCGYGHLLDYLKKSNTMPKDYLGIDCEEFMINIAKDNHKNFKFEIIDIVDDNLPLSDYYFCSGAMNILPQRDVLVFIEKCFHSSQKAFIFNFITNSIFDVSKKDIITLCKKLSNNVQIKENYIENDFSICLKK